MYNMHLSVCVSVNVWCLCVDFSFRFVSRSFWRKKKYVNPVHLQELLIQPGPTHSTIWNKQTHKQTYLYPPAMFRRFRSRSNFVDELYFTEAEAMLIEAYYTAICASDTPPPGLRACVVVDFEAICNGDAKTLAALAVGFRVTIEQMQAVYQLKVAGPNPHNYTAGQLAVAKQFFKGRTSALYSHAGNAL